MLLVCQRRRPLHPFLPPLPCFYLAIQPHSMKHTLTTAQRPRSVTIILWGVFLFGVWNVGRALALYQQMDLLLELALRQTLACGL
ncbi:MAG: hypothetical protein M5U34_12460 [Chloroflexi bacterium]|nr:hypothetical protein [Chloroflexota bacterium]